MAVTLRARKTAYDNIAVGSATGSERTIAAGVQLAQKVGALDNIAVGSAFATVKIEDDIVAGTATLLGERLAP